MDARILVVDDNTDARLFLQRSLDDEYHVLVAANGREALKVLAKNSAVSIVVSTGATYYNASAYVSGVAGGYVSPEFTTVEEGESVTFYITTSPGYQIAAVYDSNGNAYGASSVVTISNVKSDVSLGVEFQEVVVPPDPTSTSTSSSTKKKNS